MTWRFASAPWRRTNGEKGHTPTWPRCFWWTFARWSGGWPSSGGPGRSGRGATVRYLPPYSHDFNPIESAWGLVKNAFAATLLAPPSRCDGSLSRPATSVRITANNGLLLQGTATQVPSGIKLWAPPRRVAGVPQIVQHVPIADSVHRVPEAIVTIGHELALSSQTF